MSGVMTFIILAWVDQTNKLKLMGRMKHWAGVIVPNSATDRSSRCM